MSDPMTTDEQRNSLGQIKRKAMQIDLLTMELVAKPPRRGNGRHIRLHDQAPAPVPGMAYFPGTGPEGKYCRDCANCCDLPVWRNGRFEKAEGSKEPDPRYVQKDACRLAAKMFGGVVQRGGIGVNRSCRHFEESR